MKVIVPMMNFSKEKTLIDWIETAFMTAASVQCIYFDRQSEHSSLNTQTNKSQKKKVIILSLYIIKPKL